MPLELYCNATAEAMQANSISCKPHFNRSVETNRRLIC